MGTALSGEPERPTLRIRHPWAWAVLGIAPFLLVYLFPVWNAPADHTATGFVQYDQASYIAHGRAMFERGHGLAGPNPYEISPDAPRIYFHALNWLLGAIVLLTGLDPGLVYVGLGLILALIFGRLTLALVERCGAGRGPVLPVFLMVMWGGGAALIGAGLSQVFGGPALAEDPLRLEPFRGWWFLYWGRNLVFTTEAAYHVLMLGGWLMLLKGRWGACLAILGLTLATHPYTGVQALAIMITWAGLNSLRPGWSGQVRAPRWFGLGLLGMTAVFLLYYFGYLPSFESHRLIQKNWGRAWSETSLQSLVAYAPVVALALIRLVRDKPWARPETAFLLTAAAVSFGLSHHHWVMSPHMPLHFTRGYVWLPLMLLAGPYIAQLAESAQRSRTRLTLVAGLALIFCTDNIAWLWLTSSDDRRPVIIHSDLHDLYRRMDAEQLTGTVLADHKTHSYLVSTYTRCQGYLGHMALTPGQKPRARQVKALLKSLKLAQESGEQLSSDDIDAWFEEIDYLLWKRTRPVPTGWVPALETAEYVLFEPADVPK